MNGKLKRVLIVSLLLSLVCVGTSEAQRRRRMKDRPKRASERVVTPGVWGGAHIRLDVEEKGATVQYDCAHGSIDEQLALDAEGHFDARGTFVHEGGGSIRIGINRVRQPARYEGQVSGGRLSLTVTLTETSQAVGTYTLTRGSEGRVRKCR
ncbi:MAG: hypothetical protein QOE47_1837 [Pyrinomonadaceae bacterium]|nr:hypothetical protein [Pyrinomonadaceae bacterium]